MHTPSDNTGNSPTPPVPRADALRVWLRVAALSFGGPGSQIAVMHRILVDEKKWISEERFLHALNYCMLLPGPEAQQLATYIGWLMHRTAGGLMAGLLFIAPGFVAILGLSIIYVAYGQQPWVMALFFGLKAAILAVVIEAVLRIGKRALKNNVMMTVAAVAFIGIFLFQVPFPLIVLSAALFGIIIQRVDDRLIPLQNLGQAVPADTAPIDRAIAAGELPHIIPNTTRTLRIAGLWLLIWLSPLAACAVWLGPDDIFTQVGVFFSQAAVVTFGGAYAVLAFVAQEAVDVYGWLTAGEMLDGLALAETTPGPLIMVLQFVGYLAAARAETGLSPLMAGLAGSIITVWATFVPSFLWIFTGAPYIEALLGRRWLHAALSCITAAVVGVILNLGVWFSLHVVFKTLTPQSFGPITLDVPDWASVDGAALLIAMASMAAILKFHVGLGPTLIAAALVGFGWKMFGL